MASSHDEQLVRNQVLLREINERIAAVSASWSAEPPDFLCECSDSSCVANVNLSLREYEAIRSTANLFVICHGHEHPEVDRVVRANGRFSLVEKTKHTDLVFSWRRSAPIIG